MRERPADVAKIVNLVYRQLQLSRFHRAPDVLANLVKDLADLLDGAGAEGDADIGDASRRVQVEIEIGMRATEPANIDDAALDFGRRQILVGDPAATSLFRLLISYLCCPSSSYRSMGTPPTPKTIEHLPPVRVAIACAPWVSLIRPLLP
jgi:hypothetical protein